MNRMVVIVAALVMLASGSMVSAAAGSGACKSNGAGCSKAGTYSGPNALINSNYSGGARVVWTKSVVQKYTSGVPVYWTAYITYTNTKSSRLTLACSGNWRNASFVSEHMSGGGGNDGTVYAQSTTCSQNSSKSVTVGPHGTYTAFATFHNVPSPPQTVAVTWGNAGTSPYVSPF